MRHIRVKFTPEQRANLKRLAEYLLSKKLRAKFNMETYADSMHEFYGTSCGTVGCAIGHGPYAGIAKYPKESWIEYSDRAFGSVVHFSDWLFSDKWAKTDNTPRGAALRIKYTLKHGVPRDYFEQMEGDAPLCYLEGG